MNLHVLPLLLTAWDASKEASQCSAFSRHLSYHIPTKVFLLFPFSHFPPHSLYC